MGQGLDVEEQSLCYHSAVVSAYCWAAGGLHTHTHIGGGGRSVSKVLRSLFVSPL